MTCALMDINTTINMQYLVPVKAFLSATLLASAAPTISSPLERRACSVAYPQSIDFPINYDIHQDVGKTNIVKFPMDYPIAKSDSGLLNVYSTFGANKGSLFGSMALVSSHVATTKFVINSATCDTSAIASDSRVGRVAFPDTKDASFTVTYNC
ncbi:hypothetical protein K504DRAFT_522011 [Pleomassaria siparia CBS 279.74]|uniref:Ubiquitin 3 binding protein But2 C-terminal domain-containing protein n=1 Tax=Pleomassaria siparia CBS 279.74 TaxID=1314801 RepID=A0A6G1KIA9_9PLEO|nr:hypothetical protein K504DRAFT_522011 [Pleomassaria siparia CBS 279.74]